MQKIRTKIQLSKPVINLTPSQQIDKKTRQTFRMKVHKHHNNMPMSLTHYSGRQSLEKQSSRDHHSAKKHNNFFPHTPIQKFMPEYNRPIYFLQQYLLRKQKMSFMPIFQSNPQERPPSNQPIRNITSKQFRIKKGRQHLPLSLQHSEIFNLKKDDSKQLVEYDQDLVNFNQSKNIYQMTNQQLQRSIRMKKQFLDAINKRIQQNRRTTNQRFIK